jgi:tRNA threonylcarbamoyladenosine biosynthesis protein TsaE
MERTHVLTLDEMNRFAQTIGDRLKHINKPSAAYIITLSGELGAGKTTFVQFLAQHLGVGGVVQSPTFVLARTYQTQRTWPARILHVDAYRLEGPDALRALDWERETARTDTVILLEWPECVSPLYPTENMHLRFMLSEDGGRIVETIVR